MPLALRTRDLGKRYAIGRAVARHALLRDRIAALWRRPFHREAPATAPAEVWAIRDVTLEIGAGEVVGIVGGNGAGKSTLLKILSRITDPTEGEAEIVGRIGSLLEVGTGFHPELTGRENIYLNGSILGMRRAAIDARFDAIVEFAEIGRFIDTPVKHYSSGMYVRLAFAVAAQMEPEILVIDEVLAVGDARFQNKCLAKMDDVARSGRTVLFVSHNMAAIQRLCTRAVLLEAGRVVADGEPRTVVGEYLSGGARPTFVAARRTGDPQVLRAELETPAGEPLVRPLTHEPITVRITYLVPTPNPDTHIGIGVLSVDGVTVFSSDSRDAGVVASGAPGEYTARVTIPGDTFFAGDFHVAICLWNVVTILDLQEPALTFSVDPGRSVVYRETGTRKGLVQVHCAWAIAPAGDAVRHAAPTA